MKSILLALIMTCTLMACGGSSSEVEPIDPIAITPPSSSKVPVPDNRQKDKYQVLMIGNSHTGLVKSPLTILLQQSAENVNVRGLFGSFLDVTVSKQAYIDILQNEPWTHIVLQGQKYSQSGATLYSTDAAKLWIHRAKSQETTPILYPEHPQKGDKREGKYVHGIHVNIANEEPSCVAPVGLTWDLALAVDSDLDLYALDGNHASSLGSLLSALVIYEVITGQSADLLDYIPELPGDENIQALLGQMASEGIAKNTPCFY